MFRIFSNFSDSLTYHDARGLSSTSFNLQGKNNNDKGLDAMYAKCDPESPTAMCFGIPDGCISQRSCDIVSTSAKMDDSGKVKFEIAKNLPAGTTNTYIAMGISKKKEMMDASVAQCYLDQSGSVKMGNSHNHPTGRGNDNMGDIKGITFGDATFDNGVLKCSWTREASTIIKDEEFNLMNSTFFLQVASGPMKNGGKENYPWIMLT